MKHAIKPLENYEIFHIRIYYSTPFTYTYLHFTKPFVITTNASGYAIGGLLSQEIIGKDLPIGYTSRLIRPNRELFHHRKRITRNNIQRTFFPYIYDIYDIYIYIYIYYIFIYNNIYIYTFMVGNLHLLRIINL